MKVPVHLRLPGTWYWYIDLFVYHYMLATLDTGILTLFLAFLSFFKSFIMIRFRWLESNAAVCPVLLEYRENVRTGIHAMYLVPGTVL